MKAVILTKSEQELAALVKTYRMKARVSQYQLAEIFGYTQPVFISLMENGMSKIPLQTLGELIVILKLPEKKVLSLLQKSITEQVTSEISVGKKKRKHSQHQLKVVA